MLPVVVDGVVIRVGVTLLILQENAGDVAGGEGIMVTVGGQFAAVQRLEIMLFAIDLLKKGKAPHALVAALAILDRAVVADHVDVEQVLDLLQRHNRVVGEEFRAPEVRILAGEGEEVYVVRGPMLGVIGGQRHDGGGSGGIVIGPGVEDFAPQVAQVVVMGREDVATVVSGAFDLRDHVEEAVILQELVFHVETDGLHALDGLGCHPHDGLVRHAVAVGLVELDGGGPDLEESGIGALARLLQPGELLVPIGEPEIAADQGVRVLRPGQVLEHLVRVIVQGIHVIHREFPAHARGVLPHREIHPRCEFLPVGPHLHLAVEGVDVDGEGLQRDLIDTGLLILFFQVLAGLVGPASGVAATLVSGGTEFLDNPFVMRRVLRRQLHGGQRQQENQKVLFHIHKVNSFF